MSLRWELGHSLNWPHLKCLGPQIKKKKNGYHGIVRQYLAHSSKWNGDNQKVAEWGYVEFKFKSTKFFCHFCSFGQQMRNTILDPYPDDVLGIHKSIISCTQIRLWNSHTDHPIRRLISIFLLPETYLCNTKQNKAVSHPSCHSYIASEFTENSLENYYKCYAT